MNKFFLLIIFIMSVSLLHSQEVNDSLRYNQYGVPVEQRIPLRTEMRDGILVFESVDQNYRFWFDIRVQLDGAVFFKQKDFMNPIGNGVNNRRSRFAVKAEIHKNWYGEIDTDFANGEFELKDAIIRYIGLPNWEFSVGNFKENFSMERTTSSRYLSFMERPMVVQALAPSRHLGAELKYARSWIHASAGLFFQSIADAGISNQVKDNNKDFGRNQGYSITSKFVLNPLYNYVDRGIHLGIGGSYRTPKTDVSTSDYGKTRYSVRNSTSINRKKYIDTDYIPNTDYILLSNFELAGYYKGFRFQSEYITSNLYINKESPDNINKTSKHFSGWYVHAGYLLLGGQQRYNPWDAEFTQPRFVSKKGDVEFLLRYDYLNLNSQNVYGGAGENYTVGLNYYVNSSVKFVLNYQYSKNDRYANGKGKLFVGKDNNGKPTSNFKEIVEAKGNGGIRYSQVSIRLELDF